jgi:hypothetical protein
VSIGYEVRFVTLAAQRMTIQLPALNTAYYAFVNTTVAGTIYSDSGIGWSLSLRYAAANTWVATAGTGAWPTT